MQRGQLQQRRVRGERAGETQGKSRRPVFTVGALEMGGGGKEVCGEVPFLLMGALHVWKQKTGL